MTPDDDLAIELAAELRRHEEHERAEMRARYAEVPRAIREDARENWRRLRDLGRLILRAVLR